jgi:hypothetical protein
MFVQERTHIGRQPGQGVAARRALGHTPFKDQLHLIGSADVEVLANDFFEENTACQRTIKKGPPRNLSTSL